MEIFQEDPPTAPHLPDPTEPGGPVTEDGPEPDDDGERPTTDAHALSLKPLRPESGKLREVAARLEAEADGMARLGMRMKEARLRRVVGELYGVAHDLEVVQTLQLEDRVRV
jgi:hypothetical protein